VKKTTKRTRKPAKKITPRRGPTEKSSNQRVQDLLGGYRGKTTLKPLLDVVQALQGQLDQHTKAKPGVNAGLVTQANKLLSRIHDELTTPNVYCPQNTMDID
jgi:hypothetical protein